MYKLSFPYIQLMSRDFSRNVSDLDKKDIKKYKALKKIEEGDIGKGNGTISFQELLDKHVVKPKEIKK